MTRDLWVCDLAAGLGAERLLEMSRGEFGGLLVDLAGQLPADEAEAVLSVDWVDVIREALERERLMERRRGCALAGEWDAAVDHVRRRYVVEGLQHRRAAEQLGELEEVEVAAVVTVVLEEPPGGRGAWPGLWPADRRRDGRRAGDLTG